MKRIDRQAYESAIEGATPLNQTRQRERNIAHRRAHFSHRPFEGLAVLIEDIDARRLQPSAARVVAASQDLDPDAWASALAEETAEIDDGEAAFSTYVGCGLCGGDDDGDESCWGCDGEGRVPYLEREEPVPSRSDQ